MDPSEKLDRRICAFCDQVVDDGLLQCPKCGNGIFKTEKIQKLKSQEISTSISFLGDFDKRFMMTEEDKRRVLEEVVSKFLARYNSLVQKSMATYDQSSPQVGITFIMKPMDTSIIQEVNRFFTDVIRPYRKRTS